VSQVWVSGTNPECVCTYMYIHLKIYIISGVCRSGVKLICVNIYMSCIHVIYRSYMCAALHIYKIYMICVRYIYTLYIYQIYMTYVRYICTLHTCTTVCVYMHESCPMRLSHAG